MQMNEKLGFDTQLSQFDTVMALCQAINKNFLKNLQNSCNFFKRKIGTKTRDIEKDEF